MTALVKVCLDRGASAWFPFVGDVGGPDQVVPLAVALQAVGVTVLFGMDFKTPAEFMADSGVGSAVAVLNDASAMIHDLVVHTAGSSIAAQAIAEAPVYLRAPELVATVTPGEHGIEEPVAMLADAGMDANDIVNLLHALAVSPGEPNRWSVDDVMSILAERAIRGTKDAA